MSEYRVQFVTWLSFKIFHEETHGDLPTIGSTVHVDNNESNTHVDGKVRECVLTVFDHIEDNKAIPIWIATVDAPTYLIRGETYKK